MERKKASDFPPEVLKLFDGFVHGRITRRQFLDRAGKYAVGTFGAAAMLEALTPNFAWAQQVKPDDPRIATQRVEYASPKGSGTMKGYVARPANGTTFPAVIVIHENRGLTPYIEDVARRLATEGYLALAPDGLSPVGGAPQDVERAAQMDAAIEPARRLEDLMAAVPAIKALPHAGAKWGAVGFCYGGSMVNQMATRFPDMAAAAPYYGGQPKAEDAARIRAAMAIHYAGEDPRTNAGWPAFEQVLKAHGVKYQAWIYPGTQHGFHNDTTPRYDEASAKLSWERTIALFKENLA